MMLSLSIAALPVLAAEATQTSRWGADHVLGTSLDVAVAGAGGDIAAVAGRAALTEIQRLDAVLSRWRDDSELSAIVRRGGGRVSRDLALVLARSRYWRDRTGGAFDVARPPGGLGLDADGLLDIHDGAQLDLDGLAKGYVIDRALDAARKAAPQASGVLVDLGGDLKVWSDPERARPWRLAIADPSALQDNAPPLQTLDITSGALAVSGPGLRFAPDGASHVREPWSGAPASGQLAAVTAKTAMDADALATAFLVMAPGDALTLADATPGAAAFLVDREGRSHASSGWSGRDIVRSCQAGGGWPAGYSLTASIELPRIAAANYERPYVAAWITDAEKNPVRTLLLLGPEARWRESNYIYWRRVERKDLEDAAKVARPTRSPGRYEVVWDGRTDAGALAPPGQYVLNIEVTREHGGHSFVTAPLDIAPKAFSRTIGAVQELGEVQLRFGPRR